ncbi:YetF domain-containing protein [Terrisporobacter glycolicus]
MRKFINHSPIMIVKNSEILYKELTKSRISIDILLEKLRKKSR